MKRRSFLKGTMSAGATGLAVSAGILSPAALLADNHGGGDAAAAATDPFAMEKLEDVLKALGAENAEASDSVKLKAPDVAENGAVVPITVDGGMEGVTKIALIAEQNPLPLVATFDLGDGALASAGSRIKMGKSGNVVALVMAGDKVYSASKEVKVTIGGCGG